MRHKFSVILLVALFLLNVGYAASAKVYLVSVGISDYPGTRNDLRLPVADARHIVQIYSQHAKNTEYVQLLNRDATADRILSSMRSLYAKAGPNDIVVFFFSGHGYKGGFCAYDRNLSYENIQKAIAPSRARNKMIFADACFAGKMTTPQREGRVNGEVNIMLFLASRGNETAIESPYMSNGFFTSYLAYALEGGADKNRDRVITAKELYDYVYPGVINLSQGKQHPKMWGNFPLNMKVMEW